MKIVTAEPGERVGVWVLLACEGMKGIKGQYWRVKCAECGAVRIAQLSYLKSQARKGAGCKRCVNRKKLPGQPMRRANVPEVGEQIGGYTLVAYLGLKRNGQRWEVQCECGKTRITALSQIKREVDRGKLRCGACSSRWIETRPAQRARELMDRFGDKAAFYSGPAVDIDRDLPERW